MIPHINGDVVINGKDFDHMRPNMFPGSLWLRTIGVLAAILWVFYWILIGQDYVLDDAMIHMKFGELLLEHGFFTGDGKTLSYPSSPVFTVIAAISGWVLGTFFATKIISILAYLALLGYLARSIAKTQWPINVGFYLILAATLSPFGIRWLTDGMETSLHILLSVMLADIVVSSDRHRKRSFLKYVALMLMGALLTGLRLESAFLIAISSLYLVFRDLSGAGERINLSLVFRSAISNAHLSFGVLIALGLMWAGFGHLLPDTAVAKELGLDPARSIYMVVHGTGATFSFGILLWLAITVSIGVLLYGLKRNADPASLILVLIVPLGILLIVMTGVDVQSIRHFSWLLYFGAVAASLRNVEHFRQVMPGTGRISRSKAIRSIVAALVIITSASWIVESIFVNRIMVTSGETLRSIAAVPMDKLRDKRGIAGDVGFAMYFSGASICDFNGLINGRTFAAMSFDERVRSCVSGQHEFLFVSPLQLEILNKATSGRYESWIVCGTFTFENVLNSSTHRLLLHPALAGDLCK
ncbi:MAG: hypothetical protein ACI9JL_004083 [Paracoccaceae bacterium]|jgi:hypothetical protein